MARRGTITAWLRKRISHLDYGTRWRGGIVHCNTNKEVLNHFAKKKRVSYLSNAKLAMHFSGEDTFYFTGNSWGEETLVMIDIDCHGTGSLQGAMSYAQFLKDTLFPNLYYEPSTNGNGAHGYFVLEKDRIQPQPINDLLGQLEAFLRQTIDGFDIENVEIKGRCPVVVWGSQRGEVANYKAGTLAKFPRQADRFEELKNTARITARGLRAMISRSPIKAHDRINPVETNPPSLRSVGSTPAKQASILVPAGQTPKGEVQAKKMVVVMGSCSDRVISRTELDKLSGHYLRVAGSLLGTHPIKTGRVVATAQDLAIFLMLLRFFTTHMNQDGSLPWARFKGLWDSLFEAGDIDRAFDPKRFAALRNYLSSLGLIEWEDNRYERGYWQNGVKMGGKACKWRASEILMEMLKREEREEEASLAGTETSSWLQNTIENLEMLPFGETMRPIEMLVMPLLRVSEAEVLQAMGLAA